MLVKLPGGCDSCHVPSHCTCVHYFACPYLPDEAAEAQREQGYRELTSVTQQVGTRLGFHPGLSAHHCRMVSWRSLARADVTLLTLFEFSTASQRVLCMCPDLRIS